MKKQFTLTGQQLALNFNELPGAGRARFQIKTSEGNQLKLNISYAAYGRDGDNAFENIEEMDYQFSFTDNTLILDKAWSLKQGALYRTQSLSVTVEVPQNITVVSSVPLVVVRNERPYNYRIEGQAGKKQVYLSSGLYFYEHSADFKQKLSSNETIVLKEKFCEVFFTSGFNGCLANIRNAVTENKRLNQLFDKDKLTIDQLRQFLLPNRDVFVTNLSQMNDLAKGLSNNYPQTGGFQQYIERLLLIKTKLRTQ